MKTAEQILAHLTKTASGPLEEATGADPEFYWNPDIEVREDEKIFRKDWVCTGLAAEIPQAGDYITSTIAGEPVYCIRDRVGSIRTYSNICRHRMMKILKGSGQVRNVVCPYHAWTYNFEGELIGAGHMESSKGFEKVKICLPEIRTEIWGGWIYITLNPEALSVSQLLEPLNKLVSRYQMETYVPTLKEEHIWKTNWKLLVENFMESYHLPIAHKATVGAWLKLNETVFPKKVHEAFTYQTFGKSETATYGFAHPDNKSLKGKWRSTSVMPTVFPSHMYVLAPDHVWYLSLRPRGVGEVAVTFGLAIAPEVDASFQNSQDREMRISELSNFFEHVNSEDRAVVEGIYAGSRSSFSAPGPLSWLEREIHDFHKYLVNRLTFEHSEKTL